MDLYSLGKTPLETLINALLRTAVQQKARFALWKHPEEKSWRLLVSLGGEESPVSLQSVLHRRKGFILHPFSTNTEAKGPVFLEADAVLEKIGDDLSWTWSTTVKKEKKEQFEGALQRILRFDNDPEYTSHPQDYSLQGLLAKPYFIQMVEDAISQIDKGEFSKVVVARAAYRNVPKIINFAQFFEKLSGFYPQAFVSLVYLPGCGFWVGASPEILMEIDKNHYCSTVALAGTLFRESYKAGTSMCSWSEKELHEHMLVSQYIQNVLYEQGIENVTTSTTRSHAIAHLFHLRKDFSFDLYHPQNRQCDLASLIYGLHPTPAVCGLPKQKALDYIQRHENFNRSFYAGFLGPVNMGNKVSLFVNIRCMNIQGQRAILYAGAGITSGSDPEKEWEETDLKMKMMANMLDDDVQCLADHKIEKLQ